MADSSFNALSPAVSNSLMPSADQLVRQSASATENSKIEKSAKDFESILLENWLQQAEKSFGSVPGEEDDDEDPGKEQYQSFAMQALGTAMTNAGGIGIAKMVAKSLHKAADAENGGAAKSNPVVTR